MRYDLLILFVIAGFQAFATAGAYSDSSLDYFGNKKKIDREIEKNEKKCLKDNKLASGSLQINSGNAAATISFLECSYEKLAKNLFTNPKKPNQFDYNSLVEDKLYDYRITIDDIRSQFPPRKSFNETRKESDYIVEEVIEIIEEKTTLNLQPKTYEDAWRNCTNKGFKPDSYDSLESYLFKKCMEEEGFAMKATGITNPRAARHAPSVKREVVTHERVAPVTREKLEPAPRERPMKRLKAEAKPKPEVKPKNNQNEPKRVIIKSRTICKTDEKGGRQCTYDVTEEL